MNKKAQFDRLVAEGKNIVLTTHLRPDFDAICSLLAVDYYLRSRWPAKKITMIISGEPDNSWHFLPQAKRINWVDDLADCLEQVDLVVFLDSNRCHRFSIFPERINLDQFKSVCIDHHPGDADSFSLNLIDSSAIATCQIVADNFFLHQRNLNKDVAKILLIGILSDSGYFHYLNYRNSAALKTIKRLIDFAKIDLQLLLSELKKITEAEFEVIKILVNHTTNIKLKDLPGLTYSYLPRNVLSRLPENIITRAYHRYLDFFVRQINGYSWGFVVVPRKENEFGISFRSLPGKLKMNRLAKIFEGGGHYWAAGGKYRLKKGEVLTAQEVCQKILTIIEISRSKLID